MSAFHHLDLIGDWHELWVILMRIKHFTRTMHVGHIHVCILCGKNLLL